MTTPLEIVVNGTPHSVAATPETPLLYVLRNELSLHGPRFGCGLAQCGACTVHVAGAPVRSCVTPVAAVRDQPVTTLEGLAAQWRRENHVRDPERLHPVQQAFIDEQAMQCGYCSNGWIMTAAAMLDRVAGARASEAAEGAAASPRAASTVGVASAIDDAGIRRGLSGLKCRCGAHMAIMRAVKRAAGSMT